MSEIYFYILFFTILETIYIIGIYKFIAFPEKRLTKKQYMFYGITLILTGSFLGMMFIIIEFLFGALDLKTILENKEMAKELLNLKAILFITNTTFLFLTAGVGVNILSHGIKLDEKASQENCSIYLENRLEKIESKLNLLIKLIISLIIIVGVMFFYFYI